MYFSCSLLILLASTSVAARGLGYDLRYEYIHRGIVHPRQGTDPISPTDSATPTNPGTPTDPITPSDSITSSESVTSLDPPMTSSDPVTSTVPDAEPTTTVTKTVKTTSVVRDITTKKVTVTEFTTVDVTSTVIITDTLTEKNVATATDWIFETVTETTSLAKRYFESFPDETDLHSPYVTQAPSRKVLDLAKRALVTVNKVETVLVTSVSTFLQTDKVVEPKTNIVTKTNRQIKTIFENAQTTVTSTSTLTLTSTFVGAKTVTGTETATVETTDLATATTTVSSSSTPEPAGSSTDGLSTGAKAGIGAGAGIVALIAFAGIIVFFRQQRQKKHHRSTVVAWDSARDHHDRLEPVLPSMAQTAEEPSYYRPAMVGGWASRPDTSNNSNTVGTGPSSSPSPNNQQPYSVTRSRKSSLYYGRAPVVAEMDGRRSVPMSDMSGETAAAGMSQHNRQASTAASELEGSSDGPHPGSTSSPHSYQPQPQAAGVGAWNVPSVGQGRDESHDASELDNMMYQHMRNTNGDTTELHRNAAPPEVPPRRGSHGTKEWQSGPVSHRYEMP